MASFLERAPSQKGPTLTRHWVIPILQLAVPLTIGQLGQMGMILIDMYMVGQLGPAAIAGVGLGSALFYVFALFCAGTLFGLDHFVATAVGRGAIPECHHWLWQGLYLAAFLSLPMVVLIQVGGPQLMGWLFARELALPAGEFLRTLSWSLPGFLGFITMRQYLQSMGSAHPGTVVTLMAVFSNVFFNWVFIFGHGVPALGVAGAGLATTTTRILMAIGLGGFILLRDKRLGLGLIEGPKGMILSDLGRLLRLGVPTGLQFALETGVFTLVAFFIGRIGAVSTAAHTLVSNVAGFTYTIPIAISSATSILVGQSFGRGDRQAVRLAGWCGIGLAVIVMIGIGAALALLGHRVAGIFTDDARVIRLASQLLALVALFQVADGIQATCGGALRGLGSTADTMIANFVGYWAFGLPLGYVLCFHFGWGAMGFWVGLSAGIFAVTGRMLVLWLRVDRKLGQVSL